MEKIQLNTPLKISEIDFRIQSINKGGYATILAYKDARADMNRLDEVLGVDNWQRDHKEINGTVYCGIGIRVSDKVLNDDGTVGERLIGGGNWVWKWDAGAESFTEKEKGLASDSFKRACFNLGIGRELYDYPLIQVKLNQDEFEVKKDRNGKERAFATWNLKLRDWIWFSQFTDGKINYLGAKDEKGNKRYSWGKYLKDA